MKTLANDINIYFRLTGKMDGATVALSHSLGSSSSMWEPQLSLLESEFRVLRIDTRGHGDSAVPAGPYSMDMLVDDAIGLLDALHIEQFHWVGLSMGGMIGQGLALRAPERLHSLALCNTMAVVPNEAKETWKQRIKAGEQFGTAKLVDFAMERWFTEHYRNQNNEIYQMIRNQFLDTSITGYVGCCHAIFNLNYLNQLETIKVPTHIIAGELDLATPVSESVKMKERIPNSTMEVIPGATHLSNIETAEIFNASLLNFLKSV